MAIGFFPDRYIPDWFWAADYFPDAPDGSQPPPAGIERVVFTVIGVSQPRLANSVLIQSRLVDLALRLPRLKNVRIIS